MLQSRNLLPICTKRYMLRPVARCRAGCSCRMEDAGWRMQEQDEKSEDRIQETEYVIQSKNSGFCLLTSEFLLRVPSINSGHL